MIGIFLNIYRFRSKSFFAMQNIILSKTIKPLCISRLAKQTQLTTANGTLRVILKTHVEISLSPHQMSTSLRTNLTASSIYGRRIRKRQCDVCKLLSFTHVLFTQTVFFFLLINIIIYLYEQLLEHVNKSMMHH